MAQSLETLRSALLTSVFGRRLGMTNDEYVAGVKDVKLPVQDLTSLTTATVVNGYGKVVARITGVATTAAGGAFVLSNPTPGVDVELNYAQTSQAATAGSTGIAFIRSSTGYYIQSSDGSTGVAVLLTQGSACTLRGLATDLYMFVRHGTSGAVVVGAT